MIDKDSTLRCLPAWLTDAGPPPTERPRTDVGWVELARQATQSGLAGLVLEHASRHPVPLPTICFDRLRTAAVSVAVRQSAMMAELERLVEAFNRARVPVMLLKGAALNLTAYAHPSLRPMSDLDLLVRPEHIAQALRVLADCGCQRGYELIRDDFFPTYHYELELFTTGRRSTRLDLHARPLRPLRLSQTMPDDALWDGAIRMDVGAGEAWIPKPELMFLHLAAHAAYHGCARLLWLYDLKRFAEYAGPSIDWTVVTDCARRWRLSCAVLKAIERSRQLLGPTVPAQVVDELSRHPATWRDRWTLRQAPCDADSPLLHVLCNVICTPGVRIRAGYLMAHLLPGPRHLSGMYPYRHRGWIMCAHLCRAARAAITTLAAPMSLLVGAGKQALRRLGRVRTA